MDPSLDKLAREAQRHSGTAGGERAFADLARSAGPVAWRIARRVLGNETSAADAMQEALLKLATKLDSFDGSRAFLPWFTKLAVNAALDQVRRDNSLVTVPLDSIAEPAGGGSQRPDAAWEQSSWCSLLEKLGSDLAPRTRAVFVLRDLEGYEVAEIAQQLDMAPSTVRVHLARARQQIRKKWQSSQKIGEGDEL